MVIQSNNYHVCAFVIEASFRFADLKFESQGVSIFAHEFMHSTKRWN